MKLGAALALASALALGLTLALDGCDSPRAGEPSNASSPSPEAEKLMGTWLRETRDGVHVRRVLALKPDGSFTESVHAVEPGGATRDFAHEGFWIFDGTNLKRRYTLVDGQPPSRIRLPFATFEIAFDSRDAFTGIDHVHGHRVHYERVADETLP